MLHRPKNFLRLFFFRQQLDPTTGTAPWISRGLFFPIIASYRRIFQNNVPNFFFSLNGNQSTI